VMILVAVLVLCIMFLSIGFVITQISVARYSSVPWKELVERLQTVDMKGIEVVAQEYLRPQEGPQSRTEGEKLTEIGGTDGLAKMRHNVDVMIAIAARAQGGDDPKGAGETLELMRRDANKVKSAIVGQGIGRTLGYGKHRVGSYVTEATAAYYLMVQRLLAIYERGHAVRSEYLKLVVSSQRGRVDWKAGSRNVESERERLV
jgi:hypothetical protein